MTPVPFTLEIPEADIEDLEDAPDTHTPPRSGARCAASTPPERSNVDISHGRVPTKSQRGCLLPGHRISFLLLRANDLRFGATR